MINKSPGQNCASFFYHAYHAYVFYLAFLCATHMLSKFHDLRMMFLKKLRIMILYNISCLIQNKIGKIERKIHKYIFKLLLLEICLLI